MGHCVVIPKRRSNPQLALAGLILGAGIAMPAAAGAQALDVRHGGPVIGLFGLPSPAESLALAPQEQRRFELLLQGASHSISETGEGEELLLDGESWRAALRFRARLHPRLEAGVEVPWIRHTGGSLDGLIEDWHDLFGLPDGSRDQRPSDELRYAYRDAAGRRLDFSDATGGLGDVRLTAGWLLSRDEAGSLSLRGAVELPTGSAADLTGNEAVDYTLGLSWEHHGPERSGRWSGYATAGVARHGASDLPAVETRDWGGWLHAGLGWRVAPRVELIAQLQAASSPIDSKLDAWGGSLMLGLGAGFDLGRHYRLDLGFTEDIAVETAPDITFVLRLSRR